MAFNQKLNVLILLLLTFTGQLSAQIKKSADSKINSSTEENKYKKQSSQNINLSPKRIHVLDSNFKFTVLNNKIKTRVYLPKGYSTNKKRYPVVYIPEGSNVFSDATQINNWKLDIILDSLEAAGNRTAIVVAIEEVLSANEMQSSYFSDKDSVHLWEKLSDFMADSLKPFVDKHYRTVSDANNSLIMGASLAANFSYYTFISRNKSFGKAALFLPVFELSPELFQLTDSLAKTVSGKLFYYYGEKEAELSRESGEKIISMLGEKSSTVIYSLSDSEGIKSHELWRKYFSSFIIWALADGNNSIINIKN